MKNTVLFILASVGLLASAPKAFGQAPALGAAAGFGMFTAIGAFDNLGATAIAGNIGTNVGSISGFPPGTFTGTMHEQDLVSADAAKDVDAAYAALAGNTSGTVSGTTLGNGVTLYANSYRMLAATTLTGDLMLDAQGDTTALFIFKIDGAFSAAALSRVLLLNSARWQNVYWQVNGQVELGSSAAFKGIILANGALSLQTGATLQGRGLTRDGAITLSNNAVTNTAPLAAPLPVALTSFTADRWGGTAQLRWATATEQNNAYFAVQSSTDGRRYATIGKVTGHGSTGAAHSYAWTDTRLDSHPASTVYYRLAQVDADSSTHYSPIRTVAAAPVAGGLQMQAYPSPSPLPCHLRIDALQAGPATLRLTDALGRLVAERQTQLLKGSNLLALDEATALVPGVYLVQVAQGAARQTVRLVRQ